MKNPFQTNEETSFEQGISVTKPVQAVSAAAAQQAKAFTNDMLAQLYGKSDKSKGDDKADPNSQKPSTPPAQQAKTVHKLSGNSNVGDHAKYVARQQYLDKGDTKGAENAMHHLQYYFDANIMTLEDRVKKSRQEQEQKRMQDKKQQEEDEQRKKQQEEQEKSALPQTASKNSRNRMGKKAKTNLVIDRERNKAEMNRGASG